MTVKTKSESSLFGKLNSSLALEYAFYLVLVIRALAAAYILFGNMSDTHEISRFFFLDAFISSVVKLIDSVLDYMPEITERRPKKSTIHKLKTLLLFAVPKRRK